MELSPPSVLMSEAQKSSSNLKWKANKNGYTVYDLKARTGSERSPKTIKAV